VNPQGQKGRFAEKEGFNSGMKERVGDGKVIIISMTVSGIMTVKCFAQLPSTPLIR